MPYGRRRRHVRWGRWGGPTRLTGFLHPCLLLLLHRGDAHGYNLLRGLEEFGFDVNSLNPGLVYRALHEMEREGYVVSEWGEESLGPRRRVYRLTPGGDAVLSQWVEELRESRRALERLIEAHKTHLEEHLPQALKEES